MPVTHVNRKRDTYYLHGGKTKTGKPRYWFSTKADGDLVDAIPEGYEVYENPDAQVFLRKIVPQLVTPAEIAVVEEGLKRYAPGQDCLVDVQREHIVVHHADQLSLDPERFGIGLTVLPTLNQRYMKVIRFTLVTRRTGRSGSRGGASGARSTAGSTFGSHVAKGRSLNWSSDSAPTSDRSRSLS